MKEPIPVLREIRSCWLENAYAIGLSDTSNDYPLDSNGFSSKSFLAAQVEESLVKEKGLFQNGPFLFEPNADGCYPISDLRAR